MDQERTHLLLVKYVAREATAEELEELEWAFVANPELRRLAGLLSELKQVPPKGVSSEEEQQMLERGWERLKRKDNGAALPLRVLPVVRRIGEGKQEAGGKQEQMREAIGGKEEQTGAIVAGGDGPDDKRVIGIDEVAAGGSEHKRPVRFGRMGRWAAAASVIVVVAAGVLYYRNNGRQVVSRAEPVTILTAGRGARKFAKLPDGSQLWLNAGSRIVLAAGFHDDKRELTLEGEAFFDVRHDEQHPFIIHTGALDVRVLGTSLNVRAYPGEATMETTLIEGRAEIGLAGNPQSSILLHPNEKVVIPNDAAAAPLAGNNVRENANLPLNYVRRPIVPDQTDGTIAETSWTKNKLVFRDETLAGMSTRLERWYNVKILFDDNKYQQDTLSVTFPDEPIGDIMHALQVNSGLQYRIVKDTVHIW
jgi:transmembrane sensor